MAWELIYTSAPRGLKPLSKGFCTVAMSRGLSDSLAEQLELLSDYRPLYPPNSPQAAANPATCAHWVLAGGQHVLSQIVYAGFDYTARANKLAHHLLLSADELTPGGPARLFVGTSLFRTVWDASPAYIEEPCVLPPDTAEQETGGRCTAWEQCTGDAGWGGRLASCGYRQPTTVIYAPETDPRPLLAEAVALFPPDERWRITFCTNFSALPAGLSCAWRWCVAGSPAAAHAEGKIIDLTNLPPLREKNSFIDFARGGRRPLTGRAATQLSDKFSPAAGEPAVVEKKNEGSAVSDSEAIDEVVVVSDSEEYAVADAFKNVNVDADTIYMPRSVSAGGKSERRGRFWVVAGILLLTAGGIAGWLHIRKTERLAAENAVRAEQIKIKIAAEQAEETARQKDAAAERKKEVETELRRKVDAIHKRMKIDTDDMNTAVKILRSRYLQVIRNVPELFSDRHSDPWSANGTVTAVYREWLEQLRMAAEPRKKSIDEMIGKLGKLAAEAQQSAEKAQSVKDLLVLESTQKSIDAALITIRDDKEKVDEALKVMEQQGADYTAGGNFFTAGGQVAAIASQLCENFEYALTVMSRCGRDKKWDWERQVREQKPDKVVMLAALRKKAGKSVKIAAVPVAEMAALTLEYFTPGAEAKRFTVWESAPVWPEVKVAAKGQVPLDISWAAGSVSSSLWKNPDDAGVPSSAPDGYVYFQCGNRCWRGDAALAAACDPAVRIVISIGKTDNKKIIQVVELR